MFATTTPLMPHQATAVAKMLPSRVGALFMDMGTGKTLTAIQLGAIRQEKFDRLFWFCPVALKTTIAQQWRQHADLADEDLCVWGEQVNERRLPTWARIHILGIEAMSQSARTILCYQKMVTDRSFVIVDESSYIKGHQSRRTERITELSECAKYRLVLNGTPITQGVIDLYAQLRFLSEHILGYTSFYSFAANHLEYETRKTADGRAIHTGRVVRAHNTAWLAAKMAPYVYQVKKEECLTLPEKLYEGRYCEMTLVQAEYYQQAKNEILTEMEDETREWDSTLIHRLFTALQSIVCGFWTRRDPVTKERQRLTFAHERVDLLRHVLRGIGEDEAVIIWAKYQHAVQEITAMLHTEYGHASVAQFHGQLREWERNATLADWQTGRHRFLVATQGVGGHGLTLTRAAYGIFYADSFKYSERIQAEDRQHRIGQTRKTTYVSLCCAGSIDERIAAALARKENALHAFQQQVEYYRKRDLKQRVIELVRGL